MDVLYTDPFASSLLLVGGFLLLFLELFIPSGGILGILAVACTGFGAYGLYFHQDRAGTAIVVMVAFAVYGFLMVYFILKRISFRGSMSPATSTSVDSRIDASLVGHEGVTVTALRPAGMAIIDDRKVDVVSIGDFIEKDVAVRVVEVSGNRIVVRKN